MIGYLFCGTCGGMIPAFALEALCERCRAARVGQPARRQRIRKRRARG